MKNRLIAFLLRSTAGRLIIHSILSEFVKWLKIVVVERYGPAGMGSPRIDYVMNFLDMIGTGPLDAFVNNDYKTPELIKQSKPLKK